MECVLSEYAEGIQELCRLCNINPNSDKGKRKKGKKAKKKKFAAIKPEYLQKETEHQPFDVSSILPIIKSGTEIMKKTIQLLKNDSDLVQACSYSDMARDLSDNERQILSPGVIQHVQQMTGFEKFLIASKASPASQKLGPMFDQFRKIYDKIGIDTKEGESSGSESYSSLKAESAQSSLEDAKVFTPELLQRGDGDKHKITYRFVCPHTGQFRCSLTSLVFVMEGKGEVLYNIVSWDPHVLKDFGQMQPAGPLYNIDCSAGLVSQLHFPHCEIFSEENKDGLAVAHFTGGIFEIIQPLNVTETHVIIDIRDLSRYALVWIKTIFGIPIRGQVLLFLGTLTLEKKKLNVHLLPGNVPVSEVQCWHQDKKYIETSSKCRLFPNQDYSLCCQPEEFEVQPISELFELNNFGPNYHPTFEVFLDVNIEKVKLSILDKTEGGKEVWKRRQIFLTAPSKEPPEHRRIPETEFVNTHRHDLVQGVLSAMAIADSLRSKNMITAETLKEIYTAKPRQQKMRVLLEALDSGGSSVKAEFYRLLKEMEPFLVDHLESGLSRPSLQ